VRREDARPDHAFPPAILGGERPEGLRVDDCRAGVVPGAGREDAADQLGGGERRPQPGADDEGIVLMVEDPRQSRLRVHLLDVVLGERERCRLDNLRREERLE